MSEKYDKTKSNIVSELGDVGRIASIIEGSSNNTKFFKNANTADIANLAKECDAVAGLLTGRNNTDALQQEQDNNEQDQVADVNRPD